MKFQDYEYVRPDMTQLKTAFEKALTTFEDADSVNTQLQAIKTINQLRFDFNTMSTIAYIRHSIDTTDTFYEKEKNFFDEVSPQFSQLNNAYYQALVNATHREALEKEMGSLLFEQAELSLTTFSEEIMPELQEENQLSTEYQKLIASAEVHFEGEDRNLSQMQPFMQSKDRAMRKKASTAISKLLETHEERLDEIFDKLAKIRTKMAKKLGYKSFIELAYNRWGKTDYKASDVETFRKQVLNTIVPLNTKLTKRKQARLELDTLYHYDLSLEFKSGNPTPKGSKDWMVEQATTMYSEMSSETKEFFTFMKDRELLDLETKKGKTGGGYCTFIANYNSPFIFSNFNGTKGDVDVLTHEAGHAFQMYMSRHHSVPEYQNATQDIMEIHSMSMEFFAWPWIDLFFKEDAPKYKFTHLTQATMLIAYASAMDEFQHIIYEKPELTIKERKAVWKEIDERYFPYKVYDDNDYLERGNGWQNVMHIYVVPFYMIDYALAQVSALQYWVESQNNKDNAWESYVELCKAGGSKSYLELLALANRKNPFKPGTLNAIIPSVERYLDKINDKSM